MQVGTFVPASALPTPLIVRQMCPLELQRKFNVAFPTRAGGASAGSGTSSSFQIAKTYAALQSLKSKYSIDDGDADMLVLKELLSSMTAATAVGGTPVSSGSSSPSMAQVIGGGAASSSKSDSNG